MTFEQLIRSYAGLRTGEAVRTCEVRDADPWRLDIAFRLDAAGEYCIRALRQGDEPLLHEFARGLGPLSRWLFCPYSWDDEAAMDGEFARAIRRSTDHEDGSYILLHRGSAAGHFFLRGVARSAASQAFGVQTPSLGIAIADAYQGRGLGGLAVRMLEEVGRGLDTDAIELTTHPKNVAGYRTYLGAGFEEVGLLRIRVRGAEPGGVVATYRRDERHMVYIIHEEKRARVLDYLAHRRAEALNRE